MGPPKSVSPGDTVRCSGYDYQVEAQFMRPDGHQVIVAVRDSVEPFDY